MLCLVIKEVVIVLLLPFSFANNDTFNLRYLINDTYWKENGPIFLYTGNEGDITTFAQNTGFMWEIAPEFGALLVFAEHRYYGTSLPYGNKSYTDSKYLGYLTSTQALSDYVLLINQIQETKKEKRHRNPVIAFGGSYGGMLAAWIRLKYPSSVDAAVASSAPIFQFGELTSCASYYNIISHVYKISSSDGQCVKNIKKSWKELRNIISNDKDRAWLSHTWKFCEQLKPSDNIEVRDWLMDIYGNLAMVNYPYPTDFLAPLPGHPVKEFCNNFSNKTLEGKPLITALGKALQVYTNFTGNIKCLSMNQTTSIGESGWDFQACTEMVMPMCTEDNDMFEQVPWNLTAFAEGCRKKFGTRLSEPNLAILEYGGKRADYSNIIFSNGLLDPWSGGGMLESDIPSVYTIIIPDAAHHLDLRGSNKLDPNVVVVARQHIRNIIKKWLRMFTL